LANEANLKDQRCGWLVFGVRDNDRTVVGSRSRENLQQSFSQVQVYTFGANG